MAQLRTEIDKPAPPALRVAGVAISHPERPIAEAPGHTKLDVVRYYERIGRWLLPQLAPRPIAVVKCMGGRFDDCFFQKHAARGAYRRRRQLTAIPAHVRRRRRRTRRAERKFRIPYVGRELPAPRAPGPHHARPRSRYRLALGGRAGGGQPRSGAARLARAALVRQDDRRQGPAFRRCRSRGATRGRRRRRSHAASPNILRSACPHSSPPRSARNRGPGASTSTTCATRTARQRLQRIRCGLAPACRSRCRSHGTSSQATTCAAGHYSIDNVGSGDRATPARSVG